MRSNTTGTAGVRHFGVVVIGLLTLLSCGSSGTRTSTGTTGTSAASAHQPTSTSSAATSSVPLAPSGEPTGPVRLPTDPSALPPCSTLDPALEIYTPTRWLPSVLPTGAKVLYGYSVDLKEPPGSDRWREALIALDQDGAVTSALTMWASATITPYVPTENVASLRGKVGSLGPEYNRGGPTGATHAFWSEAGADYQVLAAGMTDDEVRAFIDNAQISPTGVTDPTGRFETVARPSFDAKTATTVGIGAVLDDGGDAPIILVVEAPADPTAEPGLSTAGGVLPDLVGLRSHPLDGRFTLEGPLDDERNIVLGTTSDGQPTYVFGRSSLEALRQVIGSTAAVSWDDPHLMGIPIGDARSGITKWCRPGV